MTMDNLNVKNEIENGLGYYLGLKFENDELATVRALVEAEWLKVIKQVCPTHWQQFADIGMESYHRLSDALDHEAIWPKVVRILPQQAINAIRSMSLIKKLEEIYGAFQISDEEDIGREEIYWRLVRPNQASDVGPLHADAWFWNLGHGVTPEGKKRVKVWAPLYCEAGVNGLRVVPESHKQEWKYHGEYRHGFCKPQIDEHEEDLKVQLAYTNPGEAIVFHDKLLHGGAVNQGHRTRVSIEFTMFVEA